ncbi:phosphoribosyltransferase-like protein [Oricola cellulosilytica]|uniref:PRTase-CE domain-containing protein n=1 Tax=Oricola cellulosilytica TaxID=1429082 RepID=A0A4R0PCW0_9HYPH|nr:hypothetical protein [Oricola cellulosilytica]TCD15311.1 hypothetical protein E0D97_07185 [Oricola cellulosilytica]
MIESSVSGQADIEEFSRFIKLVQTTDWMRGRHKQIAALHALCTDSSHFFILNEMFERMVVMAGSTFTEAADWIANDISSYTGNDPKTHRIIPHDFDDKSGSSNALFEKLRISFSGISGWDSAGVFSKNLRDTLSDKTITSISVVDDFVGTGSKVSKLLAWIANNRDDIRVDIISCVSLKTGFERKYDAPVFRRTSAWKVLEKAISEMIPSEIRDLAIQAMKDLEDAHGAIPESFSFGFEQSEAAYGALDWSVPNNTFPIFWKKSRLEQSTLFVRARR